jgi:hypothetical protein
MASLSRAVAAAAADMRRCTSRPSSIEALRASRSAFSAAALSILFWADLPAW